MSQATRFVAKTVKVVTPSSAPRGVAVFGLNSVGGTTRPQPTKVVWLGTLRGPGQPRPQTGPRAEAERPVGHTNQGPVPKARGMAASCRTPIDTHQRDRVTLACRCGADGGAAARGGQLAGGQLLLAGVRLPRRRGLVAAGLAVAHQGGLRARGAVDRGRLVRQALHRAPCALHPQTCVRAGLRTLRAAPPSATLRPCCAPPGCCPSPCAGSCPATASRTRRPS